MFARVAAVVIKEFGHLLADRQSLLIILLMPSLQLLLFGYAVNVVVDHIPTVVYDGARDADSRAFVGALRNSDFFDVRAYVPSYNEAVAAIDAGRARVAISIPVDFGARILRGELAAVQVLVDGSDPNIAQSALFAADSVARAHSARAAAARAERAGHRLRFGEIEVRPVVLYNPSMLSATFVVPGLIGVILQHQALSLTAQAIVREREIGTLHQLNATPIRPAELIVGKCLPYAAIALATVAFALAVARLAFGIDVAGSTPLLFLTSLVFLLGSLAGGLLISSLTQTQWQARQIADLLTLPALLLTGFVFPREVMPPLIQQISLLFPLTYFLEVLRGIVLKGVGLNVLWPQMLLLMGFGGAVFLAASTSFRKQAP